MRSRCEPRRSLRCTSPTRRLARSSGTPRWWPPWRPERSPASGWIPIVWPCRPLSGSGSSQDLVVLRLGYFSGFALAAPNIRWGVRSALSPALGGTHGRRRLHRRTRTSADAKCLRQDRPPCRRIPETQSPARTALGVLPATTCVTWRGDLALRDHCLSGRDYVHDRLPGLRAGLSLIHISEPTRQAEISYAV